MDKVQLKEGKLKNTRFNLRYSAEFSSIFFTCIKTRVGWCVVCAGKSAPSTDICLPMCLSQKSLRSSLKHKAISSLEGSMRRSQQGLAASPSSIEPYSGAPGNILKTSFPFRV